jgi:periplasmic protein TonB
VRGNPGMWFSNQADTLPSQFVRGHWEGRVSALVVVGRDGAVERCAILHTSGDGGVDVDICTGLSRRARFFPALDADGGPAPDYYIYSGRFMNAD